MVVSALEYKEPTKAIKIAKREHKCWKCGRTIKPGDRFTIKMDWESGSLRTQPTCLECDGRFGHDR